MAGPWVFTSLLTLAVYRALFVYTRDVRKPNFGSVSVSKNPNRTEAKGSNPKFRFPRFFSKPNLFHTYSSHSDLAVLINVITSHYSQYTLTHRPSLHVFWMLRVIYKKNRTEPAFFFQNRTETEPNLKNPFRTSLMHTRTHNRCVCLATYYMIINYATITAILNVKKEMDVCNLFDTLPADLVPRTKPPGGTTYMYPTCTCGTRKTKKGEIFVCL